MNYIASNNTVTGRSPASRAVAPWALAAVLMFACSMMSAARDPFPTVTLLDETDIQGTRYSGGPDDARLGTSIHEAGDFNGDGWPDVAVSSSRLAWIVLGGVPLPRDYSLEMPRGPHILIDSGAEPAAEFGSFLSGAGDVDGDGRDDLLIGARGSIQPEHPRGAVFLIFGDSHLALPPLLPRGDRHLLIVSSAANVSLGDAGAGLGDINGDGYPDIAVSDPAVSDPAVAAGRVYVIFGGPRLRQISSLDIEALDASEGFVLEGLEAGDAFGQRVEALGDIDGDGLDDFAVSAPFEGLGGAVHVIFGDPEAASVELGTPDPSRHITLRSALAGMQLGASIDGQFDANGGGVPDLLIGAPATAGGAGQAYLIHGGPSLHRGDRSLPADADVILRGARAGAAGSSVALVPDIDGDGLAEMLIGSPGFNLDQGAAYLAYGGATGVIPLEELHPSREPLGARFYQNRPNARLGETVAGLGDRRGDLRGSLFIGAPQTPRPGAASGVVYELHARRVQDAPRNLTCEVLHGGRVQLDWNSATVADSFRIYRNGRPIGITPGFVFRFVDTSPDAGFNEYFVEPDGDRDLRSPRCRVVVAAIGPRILGCIQVPSRESILVRWENRDRYEVLTVLVNGEIETRLPPFANRVEIRRPPGEYSIEVRALPGGLSDTCRIDVTPSDLPPVTGLTCSLQDLDAVLSWNPTDIFDSFDIFRNGLPLATVLDESRFVDTDIPPGALSYAVFGRVGPHRGNPARCKLDADDPVGPILRGHVTFSDDVGTPLRRGRIMILDGNGRSLGRAQLYGEGIFQARVPAQGVYQVRFDLEIEAFPSRRIVGSRTHWTREFRGLSTDQDNHLKLPLPVLAVSPQPSGSRHWDPLLEAGEGRAPFFAASIPSGAGRAGFVLLRLVQALTRHLEDQLGTAPSQLDLIAYGSTGLAARLVIHIQTRTQIRKLALLGTPNLGTRRALSELRHDQSSRPPRGGTSPDDYAASEEQTASFLRQFNTRITSTHDTEVHLIAGEGGRNELDAILNCDSHDARVCADSALGAIPNATLHLIDVEHSQLGRASRSLALLFDEIGIGSVLPADPAAAPGGGAALEEDDYPGGNKYDGTLLPDDETYLPLQSDTSGSIIIILNTESSGGILFSIETPAGVSVEPATAAAQGIQYLTYSEGEGQLIQSYHIPLAEVGEYRARLQNASTTSIDYHLELHLNSGITLSASLEPEQISSGETSIVFAELLAGADPVLDADVAAQISSPDGDLQLLALSDDGIDPDRTAADGIYSGLISGPSTPGYTLVDITANDTANEFQRSTTLQLMVLSDAGQLGIEWSSGTSDLDGNLIPEDLWVRGEVDVAISGTFLMLGTLSDEEGNVISEAGTYLEATGLGLHDIEIAFDGRDLFFSKVNGPYQLGVELIDVDAGFVPASVLDDIHETSAYSWKIFGLESSTPFRRGDMNVDESIDISDPIGILRHLFKAQLDLDCEDAADANDDGRLDVSDAVFLLDFLFAGGIDVPPPFPDCDVAEQLGCENYPSCE